ncbi:hypothetical protein [Rubripirellula obstinata]|nr:hypothetical protein [Rubripirellula obstinata]
MIFRTLLCISVFLMADRVQAAGAIVNAANGNGATGQPYGVATIEIPLDFPVIDQTLPPLVATDPDGRILFPFSEDIKVQVPLPSQRPVPRPGGGRLLNRVGNLIREITADQKPQFQTVARRVTFLFTGNGPMNVTLSDARGTLGSFPVNPQPNPILHSQTLNAWWAGYTNAAKQQIDSADYPTWVENYLVAMLSGRLQLPLPAWYLDTDKEEDELLSTLKLVAGVEGVGKAIFRKQAAGVGVNTQSADLPLPLPPNWSPLFSQNDLADVPVEPMATRVPPECFYIRYGSFENYLWFLNLTEEYGGDISTMVSLRGVTNESTARLERQLNVKANAMSRMLGPSVIEDQAIIGRDLFLADGASMGVLFKSKNAFLLRTSFNNDRSSLASSDDSVTLEEIKIGDRKASLLSSADNRVRSFLVEDDGFFLVTNSRTIATRFLEVGQNKQSLAATESFLLARKLMPLEREDTIFAYFSPQMLRGLVAPNYLIELRRRLSAKAEIALTHLARMAAAQESFAVTGSNAANSTGIAELTSAGFLPTGFGSRPDGSGTIEVGDSVMDTRRGARGSFIPIADVEVTTVTADEASWYGRIAAEYSNRFPTIDPIMVGLGRTPLDDQSVSGDSTVQQSGIERVNIHAEIAPWGAEKYGKWSRQLGPPTPLAMRFAPDDILSVQAHVASQQLGPPTHLFAAIKDTLPPRPEDFEGILNIYRSLKAIPGYLGAWPQPGALDRLPLGLGIGTPVGPGLNRLIGGLYRYNDGSFSILSFWPDVLQATLPFLEAVDVEDTAQIRATFGNLQGSQLESWANGQLYKRARESSLSGASFLSLLTRQLGVKPDQAMMESQRVLGADLQCSLGGEYEFAPTAKRWISTAWRGELPSGGAPPDYVAPVMKWFRGGGASLTQYADRIVVDATVDIQRER